MPYAPGPVYPRKGEPVPAPKKTGTKTSVSAAATLIVALPAEARLTIDDQPTTATAARRVFVSPPLQPGRDYVYTLRAEVTRDGQPVSAERTVTVRAGQETSVTIELPATTVASSRD